MTESPIVIYDACVLYPAPLRDLLMWLANNGLVAARWSDRILSEWVENLLINRPDLKRDRLLRTCAEMNRAIPDAMVMGYESLLDSVTLPDTDDRHVLAAAITCGATVILTNNLRDFPADHLPAGLVALAPDIFLCQLFAAQPDEVLDTMREHRVMLRNPPKTVEEYLISLEINGLTEFVGLVRHSNRFV